MAARCGGPVRKYGIVKSGGNCLCTTNLPRDSDFGPGRRVLRAKMTAPPNFVRKIALIAGAGRAGGRIADHALARRGLRTGKPGLIPTAVKIDPWARPILPVMAAEGPPSTPLAVRTKGVDAHRSLSPA